MPRQTTGPPGVSLSATAALGLLDVHLDPPYSFARGSFLSAGFI